MNRRREQRESVIQRAMQQVLARGLADPRIRGLITVTGVRMTDDGKQAFVSVSILPDDRAELTMHGLRAATPHIRKDVMKRVRIREMPAIEFRLDESIKKQAGVLSAINRAASERDERGEVEQNQAGDDAPAADGSQAGPGGVEPGSAAANDRE